MTPPQDPSIFHITHVENLVGILREGGLWSDAQRIARTLVTTNIGYTHIKNRRLSRPVPTSGGGMLGDYVPFNFCPRSVMLLAVHGGHQDYGGGQEAVVHLVSCVSRATVVGRRGPSPIAMPSSRTRSTTRICSSSPASGGTSCR
jgi:ssDNA thymidine ADP-ribosyltransferase, DarT